MLRIANAKERCGLKTNENLSKGFTSTEKFCILRIKNTVLFLFHSFFGSARKLFCLELRKNIWIKLNKIFVVAVIRPRRPRHSYSQAISFMVRRRPKVRMSCDFAIPLKPSQSARLSSMVSLWTRCWVVAIHLHHHSGIVARARIYRHHLEFIVFCVINLFVRKSPLTAKKPKIVWQWIAIWCTSVAVAQSRVLNWNAHKAWPSVRWNVVSDVFAFRANFSRFHIYRDFFSISHELQVAAREFLWAQYFSYLSQMQILCLRAYLRLCVCVLTRAREGGWVAGTEQKHAMNRFACFWLLLRMETDAPYFTLCARKSGRFTNNNKYDRNVWLRREKWNDGNKHRVY